MNRWMKMLLVVLALVTALTVTGCYRIAEAAFAAPADARCYHPHFEGLPVIVEVGQRVEGAFYVTNQTQDQSWYWDIAYSTSGRVGSFNPQSSHLLALSGIEREDPVVLYSIEGAGSLTATVYANGEATPCAVVTHNFRTPTLKVQNVVRWGYNNVYGTHYTDWMARASSPLTVDFTQYFSCCAPIGGTAELSQAWQKSTFQADPGNTHSPNGFQVGLPNANSFWGSNWSSYYCLPGPEISVLADSTGATVAITNTTATPLYPTYRGVKQLAAVQVGETARARFAGSGNITFTTDRSAYNVCADVFWSPVP